MNYFDISQFAQERHRELAKAGERHARYQNARKVTPERRTFLTRFKKAWLELTHAKPLRKLFN